MKPVVVQVVNKSPYPLPSYMTTQSAGMDVCANIPQPIYLEPLERRLIPTGLYVSIPVGYEIQVRPRSGLALRSGLTVLNSPGTVDADYRGEIGVLLINMGPAAVSISPGDRIAQLVLAQHAFASWDQKKDVSEFPDTERGAGGFGSTGCAAKG